MEWIQENIEQIALAIGIFIGSFAFMLGFNLFTGRTIKDIKDELYRKYIEQKQETLAPIDK